VCLNTVLLAWQDGALGPTTEEAAVALLDSVLEGMQQSMAASTRCQDSDFWPFVRHYLRGQEDILKSARDECSDRLQAS
jgi:hypothetical protein